MFPAKATLLIGTLRTLKRQLGEGLQSSECKCFCQLAKNTTFFIYVYLCAKKNVWAHWVIPGDYCLSFLTELELNLDFKCVRQMCYCWAILNPTFIWLKCIWLSDDNIPYYIKVLHNLKLQYSNTQYKYINT